MEVHFKPETESRLNELATRSGRRTDELLEDALAGYLEETTALREMLDGRYDESRPAGSSRSMARPFSTVSASVRTNFSNAHLNELSLGLYSRAISNEWD